MSKFAVEFDTELLEEARKLFSDDSGYSLTERVELRDAISLRIAVKAVAQYAFEHGPDTGSES